MKIRTLLTSLALILVVTNCATTPKQNSADAPPKHAKRVQVAIYDSTARPATAHLDVYDTKPPERPYKVIALLTCEGAPKEEAAMTTAIFYRAQMMGADAVMSANTSFTQEGGGFIIGPRGGFGGGSSTRCVFRARAIVYTDK
jgi:hypothetical protein